MGIKAHDHSECFVYQDACLILGLPRWGGEVEKVEEIEWQPWAVDLLSPGWHLPLGSAFWVLPSHSATASREARTRKKRLNAAPGAV